MVATTKDLRLKTSSLMKSIRRGEEVIISYHGKPAARLVPYSPLEIATTAGEPVFGMWRNREDSADVPAYVRKIRKGRKHAY